MLELELSYIPDSEADTQALNELLEAFHQHTGIKVHMKSMTWGTAWADLMTVATHGKGPDVSHIGGTWVSSLAMMNALRPFTASEIESFGGIKAFLTPTWESTKLFNDPRIWSIPWTGYIYVICYRKDLFEKAGVDAETAFIDVSSIVATLEKLENSGIAEIPWLNPNVPAPNVDLLHIAASWVWSAGGDFINEAGNRVVFDSPETIKGLCGWMETYRAVPEAYKKLSRIETTKLFAEGRAAAVLTDIREANQFFNQTNNTLLRSNVGVVPTASVPWTGGGSFVIWQHVLGYPERERAAVELLKFLNNMDNSLIWAKTVGSMPARLDVLSQIYPPDSPLRNTFIQTNSKGRAYHTVPLWRRIEYQLAQELANCLREAHDQPALKSEDILRSHLQLLARRLNLTLGS